MRMFTKEELELIKEQYYKIYTPLFETDYFSVLYDNVEKEWCYVINDNITTDQLYEAKHRFTTQIILKDIQRFTIYINHPYTISDFIDNNDKMMRDKDLFKLYAKFNFMFDSLVYGSSHISNN